MCCSQSKSLSNTLGQCSWTGCGGSCPSGTTQLTQTLTGDGGDSPCPSGRRSLCCPTSGGSGFLSSTCGWYRNAFHGTCAPGCPQGKVQLAVDSAGANCARGYGSFCCDPPVNLLAVRSDPQVQDFRRLVHAFMTRGTCSPLKPGLTQKRQSSLLSPTSHDIAMRLAPLLNEWNWSGGESRYIAPFQQTWEDERIAYANHFPTFRSLADSLAMVRISNTNAVDYIDGKLCYPTVTGSFERIVCSGKTCSGGSACPLKKRAMIWPVPDDVTNQNFDTTAVRIGTDFTGPGNSGVGPTLWWQQAKNLDWWMGSNHGVATFTGEEIASSAYVGFWQNRDRNLVTGAGPVWGCTTVAVVSNFGAWTAHLWQGFFDDDTLFRQQVLNFLEHGNSSELYPGLNEYTQADGSFDLAGTTFLSVVIMTPRAYSQTQWDPLTPPRIVPGFGPHYPMRLAQIQEKLDQIFGVAPGTLNTIVHLYDSDQLIWKWGWTDSTDAAGNMHIHWGWHLDRQQRMVAAPYTGMMTIQRRATNFPGLRPAVRIYCGNELVFTQQW